jgi:TatA/E family protein of Tat protein translocase
MNFFGMGPMELGVILVIALIIFGPGKLPEIGAQLGNVVRDFRNVTGDLTGEFQEAMNDFKGAADEVRQSAAEVQDTTRSLTRLDQQVTPATKPASPLPETARAANGAPAAPTKDDPLADLMG